MIYFIYKYITLITPLGILWLENAVISNYNEFKLLNFTQKNRRVSEYARERMLNG